MPPVMRLALPVATAPANRDIHEAVQLGLKPLQREPEPVTGDEMLSAPEARPLPGERPRPAASARRWGASAMLTSVGGHGIALRHAPLPVSVRWRRSRVRRHCWPRPRRRCGRSSRGTGEPAALQQRWPRRCARARWPGLSGRISRAHPRTNPAANDGRLQVVAEVAEAEAVELGTDPHRLQPAGPDQPVERLGRDPRYAHVSRVVRRRSGVSTASTGLATDRLLRPTREGLGGGAACTGAACPDPTDVCYQTVTVDAACARCQGVLLRDPETWHPPPRAPRRRGRGG